MHLKCQVDVSFRQHLTIAQIIDEILKLSNPQIVLWYIGCYGLKEKGALFYRDSLINPLLQQNPMTTFWLMDLTAWNAFKTKGCSIHKRSHCLDVIEKLQSDHVRCISSATIFEKLFNISDQELINYFRCALQKSFTSKKSQLFPNLDIKMKEIFENCLFIEPWNEYDVSKCYSIFQYMEGCLLIDEIFEKTILEKKQNEHQIIFVLPNDEFKYYQDDESSFKNDVEFLLLRRLETFKLPIQQVSIQFLSFEYGQMSEHRPYNAPGKIVKKKELTLDTITGHKHYIASNYDENSKNSQIIKSKNKIQFQPQL